MISLSRTTKFFYSCILGLAVFTILTVSSCKDASPIKYDGVYQHVEGSEFYYLRFYADGAVISVTSTGTPEQIAKWFDKNFNDVSKGSYSVTGTNIKFSTTNSHGTVDYEGVIKDDNLTLNSFSHINSRKGTEVYVFKEN